MLRKYKLTETLRGFVFIGLSAICWHASQFFEKRQGALDSIIEWCTGMLAIFVFFPLSAIFFQNVSGLVALIIIGYIVFLTFLGVYRECSQDV